jgi:hypothetical protein
VDFDGLAAWLSVPDSRVIHQGMSPPPLAFQLARRAPGLLGPRCQAGCARGHDRQPRGMRAFPVLERPVLLWRHLRRCECAAGRPRPWETRALCGARVQGTDRLETQVRQEDVRGGPCSA